jgi:hypothetical protein
MKRNAIKSTEFMSLMFHLYLETDFQGDHVGFWLAVNFGPDTYVE